MSNEDDKMNMSLILEMHKRKRISFGSLQKLFCNLFILFYLQIFLQKTSNLHFTLFLGQVHL